MKDKNVTRKISYYLKFTARRKNFILLPVFCLMVWYIYSWMNSGDSAYLSYEDQMILRYKWTTKLEPLINKTKLLVEPSYIKVCDPNIETPLIVLVASAAENTQQRYAIRMTWGAHLPTFFVVGLFQGMISSPELTQIFLTDNKAEAKQKRDMIIFDMQDDEQNLTLKTALMISWTLSRCPGVKFLMKTEDDVLVNPWALKNVYTENKDAKLIGFVKKNSTISRDIFMSHYVPRWLYRPDHVPQHLDGSAYIMRVDYLPQLLTAAYEVPLINLEYIYFTYLVAYKSLGTPLRHDWRVNPNKPWLNMTCAYQYLASTHSYYSEDLITTWQTIANLNKRNSTYCNVIIPFLLSNNWLLT